MLSCKCLNIIIESETNDFQKVSPESLGLAESERGDDFFKKDVLQVRRLLNISKVHMGLIQTRKVGSWTINQCLNCLMDSHAVHQTLGASCVLVAGDLLPHPSIKELRNSDLFSETYNIVVKPSEDDSPIEDIPLELQTTCQGLRHILSEVLRKEGAATEERIRKFTDQQYHALDILRERGFKEQRALVGALIKNHTERLTTYTSSTMSSSPCRSTENVPFESSLMTSTKRGKLNSPGNVKISPVKPQQVTYKQQTSLDAEGLFEFEEQDDIRRSYYHEDLEESDTEEVKEENSKISKSKNKPNIAKSLPMNIPVFMTSYHHQTKEDLDDVSPIEDHMDIAASIKALAKSVHGDAVFGDLPRPRFSTHM